MNCTTTMVTRLVELKNRLELLKREAEAAVSNVRCIVSRGNSLVTFQESIKAVEHFLTSYPNTGTELDLLVNSLVKFNCDLEISLSRSSVLCDIFSSENIDSVLCDENQIGMQTSCESCSKERKTIGTSTDNVSVNNINELDRTSVAEIYNIGEEFILEMKLLHGDDPSQFWLGYYSDHELQTHLAELKRKLHLGELHHITATPVVGQFIIGRVDTVFRGCVLSVWCREIVALDIDTGAWKLLSEHDIWDIGDCILRFPPQALLCKLWSVQSDVEWNKYLSTCFRNCLRKCNLVVTVKDIIPGVIPTFVVDVDAHDNTFLDVNISEWINAYVVPAVEKVRLFNVSDAVEETVFKDLDPFVLYREEDCSDSNSEASEQNRVCVQDVNTSSEVVEDRTDSQSLEGTDSDSDCIGSNIDETPVKDSSESMFTSACDELEDMPDIPVDNGSDHSFVVVENLQDELKDKRSYLHSSQNVATLMCQKQVGKLDHEMLFESTGQILKSSSVKCFLEKDSILEMSFFQGSDPWNFTLNYVSQKEIEELKKKVAEKAQNSMLIPFSDTPKIGDFAIGKCQNEYCRVRVTDVSEHTSMENIIVSDIDSGENYLLSLRNLWVLEEGFSLPPALAVWCSLNHITTNSSYWNVDLQDVFRKVMTKGLLRVHVEDVEYILGNWRHIVQIQVLADYVYDVSDWLMLSVFPKLKEVEQRFPSELAAVSKLDPSNVINKEVNASDISQQFLNDLPVLTGSEIENKSSIVKFHNSEPDTDTVSSSTSQTSPERKGVFDNVFRNPKAKEICAKFFSKVRYNDHIVDFKKSSCVIMSDTKYYAFLCNILSPSEFYVHIISSENSLIDKMHKELSDYCSLARIFFQNKKEAKQLILQCCAVQFENRWCRGRIIDWLDDSPEVLVFLVDYGIHTAVPFHSVQCLRSDFYSYPVFALRCTLAFISPPSDSGSWSDRSLQAFSNKLDHDTVYEIHVINYIESKETCQVLLLCGEGEDVMCINDYLVDEGFAVSQMSSNNVNNSDFHTIVYPVIDSGIDEIVSDNDSYDDHCTDILSYTDNNTVGLPNVDEQLTIVITEIVNMASFYGVRSQYEHEGRPRSTHEVLMEMNKKLSRAAESGQLKAAKHLCEGSVVIARFSVDEKWYRGRLLKSASDSGYVDVFFVDYGNVDQVHKNYIKEIRKDFCTIPFQAMRFFIDSIDMTELKDNHIQKLAQSLLDDLIGECEVVIKVVRVQLDDVKVKVLYKGRDIGAEMLNLYHDQCRQADTCTMNMKH